MVTITWADAWYFTVVKTGYETIVGDWSRVWGKLLSPLFVLVERTPERASSPAFAL